MSRVPTSQENLPLLCFIGLRLIQTLDSMVSFYGFHLSGEKTLEHTRVLQKTPTAAEIKGKQTPPSRLMFNVS